MPSPGSKTYKINECFYSIQGEGIRKGTANLFIRFTGCNLKCTVEPGEKSPGGFDCDTEFASGKKYTLDELDALIEQVMQPYADAVGMRRINGVLEVARGGDAWIIFTGGEPALQLDHSILHHFRLRGWKVAVETNGSILLPLTDGIDPTWHIDAQLAAFPIDWITVSPKVAEHAIRQAVAHEVKYVRGLGQGIPRPSCNAKHKLISPAFDGMEVSHAVVNYCCKLVKENPSWTLSIQEHKITRQR